MKYLKTLVKGEDDELAEAYADLKRLTELEGTASSESPLPEGMYHNF